eukprot:TRINITY_DN1566_c0_g1_i1.p1 TRINITY_DN1566_c0_g1~~TRINITY_DN1566_c0_g1_i1.p1  ORF type:complete len:347 (-),score=69.58 TRINITY_DN1566_c0_g1_i1:330-1370(-)
MKNQIKRSKSYVGMDEINAMKEKISRLSNYDYVNEGLTPTMTVKSRKAAVPTVNALEGSGAYPTESVNFKAIFILCLPFFPIFLYATWHFSASFVLWSYFLLITLYYICCVAWLITEIAIRPPWYIPSKPGTALTQDQLPAYWQGICHDPLYDLQLPFDEVEFASFSRSTLTLRGWFIPALQSSSSTLPAKVGIVFVHGGGRDRRAFLRHAPLFHHQGYDVLLFDLSEHGLSDGTCRGFSYGLREKEDVKAAVRWMKDEKNSEIIVVVGTSVGGSATILAAAEDKTIDAVIAENPVACTEEFTLFHLKRMVGAYAPKLANSLIMRGFSAIVGFFFFVENRRIVWKV